MLAKPHRLTGKRDFEKVQKEGKVLQSQNFGVCILEKEGGGPSRFAFVVSTKIAKDAVARNRVKRAMREAVRQSIYQVKDGVDAVFLAKTSITGRTTTEIMSEVRGFLDERGLIK